ncbi:MAG TPA: PAC2 family protein [Acidimicrobiales bacterium]|nr:PAC2 family protein [Acidimicrobiales bacterium]
MALYELTGKPHPMDRVLVLGLEGWIDAGAGGAAAMAAVLADTTTEVIGTFDSDALIDARARRPVVQLTDGVHEAITWPTIEVRAGTDRFGSGVVLLTGPEPDLRWHAFTDEVLRLAAELSVTMTVGFGAFPAPVPHTRPVRLAATATSRELADGVGFVPGTIEVPGGIHAAIEQALGADGRPATGLWARVPHYIANLPYPAASVAILDGLRLMTGIDIDAAELQAAAVETNERIDSLISNSDQHSAMLRALEQQWDADLGRISGPMPTDLPSGDELADELERFLREQ